MDVDCYGACYKTLHDTFTFTLFSSSVKITPDLAGTLHHCFTLGVVFLLLVRRAWAGGRGGMNFLGLAERGVLLSGLRRCWGT